MTQLFLQHSPISLVSPQCTLDLLGLNYFIDDSETMYSETTTNFNMNTVATLHKNEIIYVFKSSMYYPKRL